MAKRRRYVYYMAYSWSTSSAMGNASTDVFSDQPITTMEQVNDIHAILTRNNPDRGSIVILKRRLAQVSSRNDGYPAASTTFDQLPRPPAGPALPTGGPHTVHTEPGDIEVHDSLPTSPAFGPAPYPPLQRVAAAILEWAGARLYDQAHLAGAGLIVTGLGKHVSPNLVSARQLADQPWAVEVAALRWAAGVLRDEHQDDAARLVDGWAAGFEALP